MSAHETPFADADLDAAVEGALRLGKPVVTANKALLAAQKQVERQEIETFRSTSKAAKSSPNATIGDAIKAKLQAS